MKVLVSGDRGYIGAVLVPTLRNAGHEVVGLDAGWYDGCDFGEEPTGYRFGRPASGQSQPMMSLVFEAVVHLAAISNDPIGHPNPKASHSVNAHGAAHMARTVKAAGVPRFPSSSSCSRSRRSGSPWPSRSRSWARRTWPSSRS